MGDPFDRLLQVHAITDVLVAYCRLLDRMELGTLAALFTADCQVSYGDNPLLEASGRIALEESLTRMWRWRRTAHHLSNVTVSFEAEDVARAESAVWAWHEAADRSQAEVFGIYKDRLERREGIWRISERRMEMNGSRGGFRVPVHSARRAPPPVGWTPPLGLDG